MMKLKQKFFFPYLLAAASILLLTAVVQMGVVYKENIISRERAQEMSLGFVQQMTELLSDEKLRYEAMALKVSKNSRTAMELKARRLKDMELLILVNPWNPVPEGYEPELAAISDTHAVDVRCEEALRQMIADCVSAGASPYICSSYRTQEMQEYLYQNKISRLIGQGYSPEDAPAVAARSVAVPGTSEHQLGLAVDIIDEFFPDLTYMQEYTYTQQWLIQNCWKYGFILRYPNGTTDITGIIYEPWHYRYVGLEPAEEIYELGVTFEEYLLLRRGH